MKHAPTRPTRNTSLLVGRPEHGGPGLARDSESVANPAFSAGKRRLPMALWAMRGHRAHGQGACESLIALARSHGEAPSHCDVGASRPSSVLPSSQAVQITAPRTRALSANYDQETTTMHTLDITRRTGTPISNDDDTIYPVDVRVTRTEPAGPHDWTVTLVKTGGVLMRGRTEQAQHRLYEGTHRHMGWTVMQTISALMLSDIAADEANPEHIREAARLGLGDLDPDVAASAATVTHAPQASHA